MKIYTLTLNPAYDVHAHCADLQTGRENFVSVSCRDAGGKGINISRALYAAGIDHTALVILGRENGAEFVHQLARFGFGMRYIETNGRIRENLTIHHGGEETRISFSGFQVDEALLDSVLENIETDKDAVVTFTGSLPMGISKATSIDFLMKLKMRGVKLVLDCRSFELADIRRIAPWLVKPNQQEVSQWFGTSVSTISEAAECARRLNEIGVEKAIVSMGEMGAVLACGKVYHAAVPMIEAVSTIGAGDSSIAGFLVAASEGRSDEECLKMAVSFGTAACLTEGTQPPQMNKVLNFDEQIVVREV